MAYPSKIEDPDEIRRWIMEGRTYQWMVDQYREKYHKDVSRTMFSNFRALHGLPPRQSESLKAVIPWRIEDKHRNWGWDIHLHNAARLMDGLPVGEAQESAFRTWWEGMQANGWVVDYDPEVGYYPTPRREGIDNGYIREPANA